ncbi:kinase-like protein [Marasmius fiardii PR-910]|nr:kinase-like protein [Marasmius fiardii PR-910]
MGKSSIASASAKNPPPRLSAWAKGPPTSRLSPDSQLSVDVIDSRPPSIPGEGVPIRDGVEISRNTVGVDSPTASASAKTLPLQLRGKLTWADLARAARPPPLPFRFSPDSQLSVDAIDSRPPSTLGEGVPIKDGVDISRNTVGVESSTASASAKKSSPQLRGKSTWANLARAARPPPFPFSPDSQLSVDSRPPSTLGEGVPIKDGVDIFRNTVGAASPSRSATAASSIEQLSPPVTAKDPASPENVPVRSPSARKKKKKRRTPVQAQSVADRDPHPSQPPAHQTSSTSLQIEGPTTTPTRPNVPNSPGQKGLGQGDGARPDVEQDLPAFQDSAPGTTEKITSVTHDQTTQATDMSGTRGILNNIRFLLETVLRDKKRSKELLENVGEDAQLLLDTLQALVRLPGIPTSLRSSILKMMLRLSKKSGLFPQCLIIENAEKLGDYAVGGGGFGDVWKGKIGEQVVCLKVVKAYLTSDVQKLLKDYVREAIVWQQLEHPNLLPFMGMHYLNEARTQLCLVSPWMEQGNLTKYLETTPKEDIDHYLLVHDVASGLSYLHRMKIVHGDLKGLNILITPDGRACIGDFGLSQVADSHAIHLTSTSTNSSTGTIRWSSPELLMPPCTPSTFSDMYAFAGVCYEIFTGNVPFHGLNDGAVIFAVMVKREHPSRPESTLLNDGMWNIMVDCWNSDPRLRPTASELPASVTGLKGSKSGRVIRPAPEWDMSNLSQIWKDVKNPSLDTESLERLRRNLGVKFHTLVFT